MPETPSTWEVEAEGLGVQGFVGYIVSQPGLPEGPSHKTYNRPRPKPEE